MAQPNNFDKFSSKLGELESQNASVDAVLQMNRQFNTNVKSELRGINAQLYLINQAIQDLISRLQVAENTITSNGETIAQNEEERQRLTEEISKATAERDQITQDLEQNQRNRAKLQEEADKAQRENAKQLNAVLSQLNAEKAEILNANDSERTALQSEIIELGENIKKLTSEKSVINAETQKKIAELDLERNELKAELEKATIEVQNIAQHRQMLEEDSSVLLAENLKLNELLKNAIPIIEDAKNKLQALSSNTDTDQNEITSMIASINENLSRINQLLKINSTSRTAALEPSASPYSGSISDKERKRLAAPGSFEKGTFRTKEVKPGVKIVIGKKPGSDKTSIQAIIKARHGL